MERKEAMLKTGSLRIFWAVMAVLLPAVPCIADLIYVDGTNSPYVLETEVAHYLDVAGTDPDLFPNGPGTLKLMPGGYASWGVNVNAGGTIEIYGSHQWNQSDVYVNVALSANATLFTDSTSSIILETAYGPDATLVGTTITVDVDNGWTGKLTWDYEGTTYSLDISTLSDIAIEVVGGGEPTPITIDIKPGSYPNPINQGSNGVIPVAILTTDTFNAADVDPGTVILNGATVAMRGKSDKLLARLEDVDGDGDNDLMLQVDTESWADLGEDGEVILSGTTYDGKAIEGKDYVVIVPPE